SVIVRVANSGRGGALPRAHSAAQLLCAAALRCRRTPMSANPVAAHLVKTIVAGTHETSLRRPNGSLVHEFRTSSTPRAGCCGRERWPVTPSAAIDHRLLGKGEGFRHRRPPQGSALATPVDRLRF